MILLTESPEQRWYREIANDCPDARPVRGGAMCRYPLRVRDYCGWEKCPRRAENGDTYQGA